MICVWKNIKTRSLNLFIFMKIKYSDVTICWNYSYKGILKCFHLPEPFCNWDFMYAKMQLIPLFVSWIIHDVACYRRSDLNEPISCTNLSHFQTFFLFFKNIHLWTIFLLLLTNTHTLSYIHSLCFSFFHSLHLYFFCILCMFK